MFRSKSPHTYIKELDRAREPAMTMPTPRLVIFTLGGTLAYLGLAILGWGEVSAFFSHSSLIALSIVLFVLFRAALFSEGNLMPGERGAFSHRCVVATFLPIG